MKKKQRRRVDRERVKSNAAEASGGGLPWLRLPKGITAYRPERAGGMKLDIVPYEVKTASHPDRVESGTLWYKYPFMVHYSVGVNNESVACPVSVGKHCPICEQRAKLAKNWDENEETVRSLTPQKWVAYNIIDPDDSDGIRVFLFSRGKFAEFLENELLEGDEANLNFYDVTDDGRTIKVRFSEETYEGRKFLKATRIDFIPRSAMDEDEVISKVACLDEILVIYDYKQLERMFGGEATEPSQSSDEDEDVDKEEAKPVSSKKPKMPVVSEDVDDDEEEQEPDVGFDDDDEDDYKDHDDDDDDDEDEPEPPPVKAKKSKLSPSKKAKKPVETEDDEEDGEDGDDD